MWEWICRDRIDRIGMDVVYAAMMNVCNVHVYVIERE